MGIKKRRKEGRERKRERAGGRERDELKVSDM